MSKIKIKNFGPIKEGFKEVLDDGSINEWIDVQKVTVFIGNQGSGKSTVAKLITTFLWIEKALTRGDYKKNWFTRKSKLKTQFLSYFRLENYLPNLFIEQCYIEYEGNSFRIIYENNTLNISEIVNKNYELPQIMYVPAERNFISYVRNTKELKIASESLREFLSEFEKAKTELNSHISLPINNVFLEYDRLNDIFSIKGTVKNEDYKVRLSEASSGFQSIVPLYLVSWYLANKIKWQSLNPSEPMSPDELERYEMRVEDILNNNNLSYEQQRTAISVLSKKFNKSAFINIVEEPEQNLFPSSQREMLHSLLGFNKMNDGNKLIMTTHSPYLINYLSLCVKAESVFQTLLDKGKKLSDPVAFKIHAIVPKESTIKASDLVIYELNETDGTIIKLGNFEGIPSDKNYLNQSIRIGNIEFDKLLEIEEEL